jgi:hypothetical protein
MGLISLRLEFSNRHARTAVARPDLSSVSRLEFQILVVEG